jgi:hypothetical protein
MHYTMARRKKKMGKPRVQTNEKRELLASRQTTKSGEVRGSKGETILRRPEALLANG